MVRFHGEPPTHLTIDALDAAGVCHAFTTRHHGNAAGDREAGPALRTLGIDPRAVRFARQVHGNRCLVADGLPPGPIGEGDAIVTATPGTPLAVFTADCLAVIVADPERRAFGVAHAGWRGTIAGILGRLLDALVAHFQVRPDRLVAGIGPSIGPCCYEVDEPVVGPLRAAFPGEWERWTRPRGPGKWSLDLWHANADQLVRGGVRSDAIANPRLCTSCRGDLFFSYRREGRGGSLAAFAALGR